jgi:hypothetical protein
MTTREGSASGNSSAPDVAQRDLIKKMLLRRWQPRPAGKLEILPTIRIGSDDRCNGRRCGTGAGEGIRTLDPNLGKVPEGSTPRYPTARHGAILYDNSFR